MADVPVANPTSQLNAATLILAAFAQDITGLKTFARAPGPPFAVQVGSAMVANLDAQRLNGQLDEFYTNASNLVLGTIPDARFPAVLPSASGENLLNLNASHVISGELDPAVLASTPLNADNIATGYLNPARGIVWLTTTLSGTVHDWDLSSGAVAPLTVVRRADASIGIVTGISIPGAASGQVVKIINIGPGVMFFAHADSNSAASNRLNNLATSAPTAIATGGWITYIRDGSSAAWRMAEHEQGAWITPAFSSLHFTAPPGSWTLVSGDRLTMRYHMRGKTITVSFQLETTTVAGTPNGLRISNGQWGGFTTPAGLMYTPCSMINNGGTLEGGHMAALSSGTDISIARFAGAWANSTDLTSVYGTITFEVL